MSKNTYNFRHASERERFYADVESAYEDIYQTEGVRNVSGLRTVFEIGGFSKEQRIKQEKRFDKSGDNSFRGLRTFRDLTSLTQFLRSKNEGGSGISWGRKNLKGENMTCRIVRYVKRGGRITGETRYKKFNIICE